MVTLFQYRWLIVTPVLALWSWWLWKAAQRFPPASGARWWIGRYILLFPVISGIVIGYEDNLLLHRPANPSAPFVHPIKWERRTLYVTKSERAVSQALDAIGITTGILYFPIYFLVWSRPFRLDRLSRKRAPALKTSLTPSQQVGTITCTIRRKIDTGTWGIVLYITCFPVVIGGMALLDLIQGTSDMDMSREGLIAAVSICLTILVLLWGGTLFFLRRTLREAALGEEGLLVHYHTRRESVVLPKASFQRLTEDRTGGAAYWVLTTDFGEVSFTPTIDGLVPFLEKLSSMVQESHLGWSPPRVPKGDFKYEGSLRVYRSKFPFALSLSPVFLRWQRRRIQVSPDGLRETCITGEERFHSWNDIVSLEELEAAGGRYLTYAVLSRQGTILFESYHFSDYQQLVDTVKAVIAANRQCS
ncbi:MAG: hypothetical protein HY318_17795 [Armatimonadetes bacterium]|nr:hypothetical protein [Armatimonadota bacterium]